MSHLFTSNKLIKRNRLFAQKHTGIAVDKL